MNPDTAQALRAAACAKLGIPDHPVTVQTTVTQAPRTGQYFIMVLEISHGPLKVHVLKVARNGKLIRHRADSLR